MADTTRSLAALQALLADNTAGDISANDVRDFLVSAYKPQGVCGHRPTTESGVSVSTSDRTSQSTVYLTPHLHNRCGLYDGTSWIELAVPEIAVVLSGLTSARNYDLFAFWSTPTHSSTNTSTDVVTWSANPGWNTGTYVCVETTGGGLTSGTSYWYNRASSTTGSFHTTLADALAGTSKVDLTGNITQTLVGVTLELGPTWNAGAGAGSDTTRGTGAGSTALTTQDGVNVNSVSVTGTIGGGTIAAKVGLYVGTLRTTATTTTEDSKAKRFVWSAYNRERRPLMRHDSTASWTYSTGSYRQANAAAANQVEVLVGLSGGSLVDLAVYANADNATPSDVGVAIGEDSTSTPHTDCIGRETGISAPRQPCAAFLSARPTLGYHYYAWLEHGGGGGTTTWWSENDRSYSGLSGSVDA